MKEYIKPELEYIEFTTEVIAAVSMGEAGGSVDEGL